MVNKNEILLYLVEKNTPKSNPKIVPQNRTPKSNSKIELQNRTPKSNPKITFFSHLFDWNLS